MKPQLSSSHEALHAVSGAAYLCSIPKGWGARVHIGLTDKADGPGHCAFLLPDHLRATVDPRVLNAWSACGPMGQYPSAAEIGRAIAERRFDEFLSEIDIELAMHIPATDQFIAAVTAHLWRARLPVFAPVALHRVLTREDFLLHLPPLPLGAFCSGELAAKLKREARSLVSSCLPAYACVGRGQYIAKEVAA